MKNREIPVNLLPLFSINVRKNAADYGKIINDEILFLSHKHLSLEAVCRVARGQDQTVDFGTLEDSRYFSAEISTSFFQLVTRYIMRRILLRKCKFLSVYIS